MAPRGAIRGILAGPDVPSPEGGNQPTLRAAGGRDARAGQGAGCGSWGRGGADASRAGGPGGRGELPTCLFGVGVAWVGIGGAGGWVGGGLFVCVNVWAVWLLEGCPGRAAVLGRACGVAAHVAQVPERPTSRRRGRSKKLPDGGF